MRGFSYYLGAAGITQGAQKKSLLLHIAGPEVQELFDTLTVAAPNEKEDVFDVALAALTKYFAPKANVAFERHVFRQATQGPDESVDDFCTRLKGLASTCEFDNRDEHVRDQFIDKCASSSLRRRLLRERNLTLDSLLDIARASEAAASQADKMEGRHTQGTVSKIATRPGQSRGERRPHGKPRGPPPPGSSPGSDDRCGNCGHSGHKARDPTCPARGQTCRKCNKVGHYGRVCRSTQKQTHNKPVHAVEEKAGSRQEEAADERVTDDDDEYNFRVHTANSVLARTKIDIDGQSVQMIVDSGASVNIIDSEIWDWMRGRDQRLRLAPSHIRLFGYGSKQPLPVRGEFAGTLHSQDTGKSSRSRVIVVDGDGGCLLSRETAVTLGLIAIHPKANTVTTNAPDISQDAYKQDLINASPAVFDGLGKMTDYQVHVHINPEVKPVAQPPRRIPFHLRKKVDEKLQELLDKDIIEPVSGPTTWASPLVVVPKTNGDIRVCVDMRRANEAVTRERHPIPTLEETLEALNGTSIFSKLDLRWGYHQVELDNESRDITTFATHKGLMRYKRLIFGLSSASEIYQHAIQQALTGLEGVRNISDDIIVFGNDNEEHDRRLRAVIERLRERNLTLNAEKCVFRTPSLTFFGFTISCDGISADDAKVNAIRNAKTPTNVHEVRSFLGLVNYCARLIENLASLAEPLRELTRGDTPWKWEERQQRSFNELRCALTSDKVIAHFVTGADTQLRVDASPVGLGAILTQTVDGITRPVAYASRTLSAVERRYSQTEKEALAVVWGCERFHMYLIGTEFDLLTDHKPLQFMYAPTGKPPARVERWVLRMQPYKYRIKHVPGKSNPADPLSRLPVVDAPQRDRDIAEEYIDAVLTYAVPKAMSREEIREATAKDPCLTKVMETLRSGRWKKADVIADFTRVRDELSVKDGVLLRGTRIVMPSSLRHRTLAIAHETHQGIVRTKQSLRTKVWWPNIDHDVEDLIRGCRSCQVQSRQPPPQPLKPSAMPPHAWHTVHVDLCGPLPTGETLLVVIDSASRWPEVKILRSTTSSRVISNLDIIFATHGIPVRIVSDNGPQFVSTEFSMFCSDNDIEHRKISPYHPQANAEVERFNSTVMKGIRAAIADKRDWRQALPGILLAYRSTTHPATKETPAKLLMNRELRSKIPSMTPQTPPHAYRQAQKRDAKYKANMKSKTDTKFHAKDSDVKEGDDVIVLQQRGNKFDTRYDPRPWKVKIRRGESVIIERHGKKTMRHLSQVRKLAKSTPHSELSDLDDLDDNETRNQVTRPQQTERPPQAEREHLRRSSRQSRPPCRLTYYREGTLMNMKQRDM